MGKNIVIAFVSTFSGLEKKDYSYSQDGETRSVSGMLTNEAPIKYFLKEYPAIDQMICLVSGGADRPPVWDSEKSPGFYRVKTEEEMKEKTGGLSPYQYLEAQIRDFAKDKELTFIPISYDERTDDYFSEKILPEILKQIHADDTIYLETTGGFRINVTQMMLLTRILQFQGTQLACAVYSDLNKGKIFDVTDSYRDFDLVNGLNEFSSTGATGLLESYFKQGSAATGTAQKLIDAMRKLTETIMLARISKVDERKSEVEILLQQAEQELEEETSGTSILTVLLPIFRSKYSQISTTPDLIKWCAFNNLIQLAFTLYSDWLPHFIMKEEKIISFKGTLSAEVENKIKKLKFNYSTYILRYIFINQIDGPIYVNALQRSTKDGYVKVIEKIDELRDNPKLSSGDFTYKGSVDADELRKMLQDYAYAVTIRNEMNHASSNEADSSTSDKKDKHEKDRKAYLSNQGYVFDEDKLDIDTLKQFLTDSMNRILELAKRK